MKKNNTRQEKQSEDVVKSKKNDRRTLGRSRQDASFPAAPPTSEMPANYGELIQDIKERISKERLRVAMAANAAMVLLYWDIGRAILKRQEREGWGAKVIDRLSVDLRREFPDMKGLSPRNLKYMRTFAAAWPDQQVVQQVAAQIPWFHNCVLLDKVTSPEARLWYARMAHEEGWSRNVLVLQIERRLYERQGKAVTNFQDVLPPAVSDMAAQIFKDPYFFDFLGTADTRREREIEQALIDHIQRFLLEFCLCWPPGPSRIRQRRLLHRHALLSSETPMFCCCGAQGCTVRSVLCGPAQHVSLRRGRPPAPPR